MTKETMGAVPLSRSALATLAKSVRVPTYDPATVQPGIVHLGLGGFHRAHMARYTHDLMEIDADARAYGILGVGLLPGDRRMTEALRPQDALYTLVEREGSDETITVIGSLAGVIFAGETSAAVLDAIDDPAIRIVSLTVTEHGYCLNPATKRLDPDHPLVRADLAVPGEPRSAIGVIVEALRRRRAQGHKPFTALSCDNIQHNGDVLRDAVLTLARLRDVDLADWISREVSFPSTMVDRITPVSTDDDIEALARDHGVRDAWPVFCEPFKQWVIEDHFPAGRPAWERVGAQFVADVAPYEFMKLRLLNASHLAVAGLGRLAGYVTIDECMADPRIAAMTGALMDRETGPTLLPVPGIDLAAYKRTLVQRFANPAIRDTVDRVNTDAPLNVLVDPIRDRLKQDARIDFLALALAAWLRRVRGEDENGRPIVVRHPMAELMQKTGREAGSDPRPLLAIRPLFGELGSEERLIGSVGAWLGLLDSVGIEATLDEASRQAEV